MIAVPNYPDTGEPIRFGDRVTVDPGTGHDIDRWTGIVTGIGLPLGAEPSRYGGIHQLLIEIEPDHPSARVHVNPIRLSRSRPTIDVSLDLGVAEQIFAWVAEHISKPERDDYDAVWLPEIDEAERAAMRHLADAITKATED